MVYHTFRKWKVEGTLLWSETGTGKVMLILLVSIEVVDVY